MKIPLSWLKEFVDVPVEPARLGDDLTMVGLACEGIETDGRDTVLDLDITTNRVDCMNVYGVAREVSVIYGTPLRCAGHAGGREGPAGRGRALRSRSRRRTCARASAGACSTSRSARRRPGCATGSSWSACGRSSTWST